MRCARREKVHVATCKFFRKILSQRARRSFILKLKKPHNFYFYITFFLKQSARRAASQITYQGKHCNVSPIRKPCVTLVSALCHPCVTLVSPLSIPLCDRRNRLSWRAVSRCCQRSPTSCSSWLCWRTRAPTTWLTPTGTSVSWASRSLHSTRGWRAAGTLLWSVAPLHRVRDASSVTAPC